MTVIQPIFYGGSGSGDVKLKSLKPQYNSMTLSKNQYIDFTVTPELDLSKLDMYEVSCDDPRVTVEHRGGDNWHIQMPDEKIPETVTTRLHFRATDDSGISVDVPLILQAGLSPEQKKEWAKQHSGEHKIPKADFEPVKGWKPFADYGSSPAEIIANCVRKKDYDALFVGDYFDETVNGTTYRWTIAEFNHYGRGEALLVPDKLMPGDDYFGDDNTYRGSTLEKKFSGFYDAMPSSLKPYVLEMTLPWTNYNGSQSTVTEHVFPPSEIEALGTTYYSKESSSSYKEWACFTNDSSRIRSSRAYWLRSTRSGNSDYVPEVLASGGPDYGYAYSYQRGALPCFCLG